LVGREPEDNTSARRSATAVVTPRQIELRTPIANLRMVMTVMKPNPRRRHHHLAQLRDPQSVAEPASAEGGGSDGNQGVWSGGGSVRTDWHCGMLDGRPEGG
jgi:hypothetical protein